MAPDQRSEVKDSVLGKNPEQNEMLLVLQRNSVSVCVCVCAPSLW